jgi:hypothetical protein
MQHLEASQDRTIALRAPVNAAPAFHHISPLTRAL